MLQREAWSNAGRYTHLGLTLTLAVLGGFFGGYWIDQRLGTVPLLAIIGTFIGAAAGFITLIRTLNRMRIDMEKNKLDIDNPNEKG